MTTLAKPRASSRSKCFVNPSCPTKHSWGLQLPELSKGAKSRHSGQEPRLLELLPNDRLLVRKARSHFPSHPGFLFLHVQRAWQRKLGACDSSLTPPKAHRDSIPGRLAWRWQRARGQPIAALRRSFSPCGCQPSSPLRLAQRPCLKRYPRECNKFPQLFAHGIFPSRAAETPLPDGMTPFSTLAFRCSTKTFGQRKSFCYVSGHPMGQPPGHHHRFLARLREPDRHAVQCACPVCPVCPSCPASSNVFFSLGRW